MKITALVENTTKTDFPTEHGLSLYIETDRHRILFDTGQSGLFAENALRLGIDLREADLCVLSHGHYDHGGGLRTFAGINETARIYMNRNAFGNHCRGDGTYIGLNRAWLEDRAFMDRVVFTDGTVELDGQLTILAPGTDGPAGTDSAGLCVRSDGKLIPEDFRHEHYLMIRENGRRVLITGCSHKGIINIMSWFRPDVLVGGFHFMKQDLNDVLLGYGRTLAGFGAEYYTCHCTGTAQYAFLLPHMERLHYLSEGESVII